MAVLLLLVRFVMPVVWADGLFLAVIGGGVAALGIFVWWAFFSRAPNLERWGGILLIVAALAATPRVVDRSIATGMMGMMFYIYAIPALSVALVVWAVATRGLSSTAARRTAMVAAVLLTCGAFTLLRTNGMAGDATSDFAWRWSQTAEARLLAQGPASLPASPVVAAPVPAPASESAAPSTPAPAETAPASEAVVPASGNPDAVVPLRLAPPEWPGFRGPGRNGVIANVRLVVETDWVNAPHKPVELWRRPIGPGWSSFAVQGDSLYTQEQRGEDEIVACYRVSTGAPVWRHRDAARFWESNAGAGPRATPTLHDGRVYTFGATGIMNALDARTGAVIWTRNVAKDADKKVPGWGFSSSPLVTAEGDTVIVAAAGKLAAYNLATGEPRWYGPDGGGGYSSPQPVTIDGVAQILLMNGPGVMSVTAADGKKLWEQKLNDGGSIIQPGLTADGDILLAEGDAGHLRRIHVSRDASGGWVVQERWSSVGLKPYFNDFVVHNGYAYGFDGRILSCIDLQDGKRKWKGGRYGNGQLVLLPSQNLLVVLSEEGELALVGAAPDQFTEFGKLPAITGKTWNHPVLAGDVVLVRNGEEMAAFRLATRAQRAAALP